MEFPESQSVGGIIGPRVKDVDKGPAAIAQYLTTQREASLAKSDVWKSSDGVHWTLVTPGCRAPQSLLVPQGDSGKFGKLIYTCGNDADCYGAEYCDLSKLTCVCSMWSSREQFALATYGDYMYVSGGYVSFLYSGKSECGDYPCGNTDASDYRYYMNDVWRSQDGNVWEPITQSAQFPGRGGHQMLSFPDINGVVYLWIMGGRGGDDSGSTPNLYYYNDIWVSPLADSYPLVWTEYAMPTSNNSSDVTYEMPWSGRLGHTVTISPGTASNGGMRAIYLVGGEGPNGALNDVWVWWIDRNYTWIMDFTPESLYSTVYDNRYGYFNNSPLVQQYVTPTSDVSLLQRYWVPSYPVFFPGVPLQRRDYLTASDIGMLRSVGVNTIEQFATADKYTILKLRGFDIPQVPLSNRLQFTDVCDKRALATAVFQKCSLTTQLDLYAQEQNMPWNVANIFGGPPPDNPPPAWHGTNYAKLRAAAQPKTNAEIIANWDGCTYLPMFSASGYGAPNVNGIGTVTQVASIASPLLELENLGCRQTPGPRAYHAALMYQENLFIFGGQQSSNKFYADTWYRDSYLPSAFIVTKPSTRTSQSSFVFSSNKAGCYFEYRIWDPANYRLIRPWTQIVYQTDVAWMNSRQGGPGKGLYAMYVRAIDPAGNRDVYFAEGYNVYTWVYLDPIPWDIILGAIGGFIGLCILVYIEYRRRKKKAAMERYALKRMRRKFKAMQKEADDKGVDWRTLYEENKLESAATKRKKMLKRAREVNKERLEKDAARRDKEKEAIRLKLLEKKELLRKKRLNDGGQYGFGERTDEDLEVGSKGSKYRVISGDEVDGPSRLKKIRDKRRKPGGYNPKEYEGQTVSSADAEGGKIDQGIKKRKKADKRTRNFDETESKQSQGGNQKKDT